MSKTYDALLKAQKEKWPRKKMGTPSDDESNQRASLSGAKATKRKPVLSSLLEKERERAAVKPVVHYERIANRVLVGDFTARADSNLEEQFRKLKAVITTHNLASSLRSLLVTSCMDDEGKTTVALNLSATIAKSLDESAILLDADLRRKGLSSLLGLQKARGLSDVLAEKTNIEETIIDTEITGLSIVPAGSDLSNPVELVGSTRMKALIQHLREGYRDSYIVIDSTPILLASEASILSHMVEGIIVVVLADKTRRDIVRNELQTINREKILGVVLNCAEFETSDYHKRYYKPYSED